MKKFLLLLTLITLLNVDSFSQCAMCKATLENNISNGNIGIAAGINFGILYLFFAPYIAIGVIAFFWFRSSKRQRQNELDSSRLAG